MKVTIYVDVLLLINFLINGILIKSTALLAKTTIRKRRLLLVAAVSSVSAFLIFVKPIPLLLLLFCKLATALVIVIAAFGFQRIRRFSKLYFLFFFVSFLFGGIMTGIWSFFCPPGMYYNNKVCYFNINLYLLLLFLCICYGGLKIYQVISEKGTKKELIYQMQIEKGGKMITMNALLDTGNHLTDQITGRAVILCEYEKLKLLFEQKLRDTFETEQNPVTIMAALTPEIQRRYHFRLIPFQGIGAQGLVLAFIPDHVLLIEPGKHTRYTDENAIIGIRFQPIGNEYSALLNHKTKIL